LKNPNINEVYLFHLEKAFKQFKKYKNVYFKQEGIAITDDQWILIKIISEREGINQRELAQQSHKEPASITRIIDLLEKKELVRRERTDRRTYGLYLTTQGKKLVKKLIPHAVKIRAKGLEGISEKDTKKLIQMLNKVCKNFQ